jgi:hypothetical protein
MNQKFLNDLIKTMIPTLIVTKEQIQLENSSSYYGFEVEKKLDQHNLLKNPNLIVNDSVKLACDNLWTTVQSKVILKYGLTSP